MKGVSLGKIAQFPYLEKKTKTKTWIRSQDSLDENI